MKHEQECSKKDKRLLVLLAFGGLILLLDLGAGLMPYQKPAEKYWLEIEDKMFHRYCLSKPDELLLLKLKSSDERLLSTMIDLQTINMLTADLIRDRVAAIREDGDGFMHRCGLSPRFTFFLGEPLAINEATTEELLLVSGIGPSLARNIVLYRDINGRFAGRQDLLAVPGIGEKRAENILPSITFDKKIVSIRSEED